VKEGIIAQEEYFKTERVGGLEKEVNSCTRRIGAIENEVINGL